MILQELLCDLGGPDAMTRRMTAICEKAGVRGAAVAVVGEDACHAIACGQDASGRPFTSTTRLGAGCVVKLYVTALVAALIRSNAVDLDDEIGTHLDFGSEARRRFFDGLSIRNLLGHTDGIGFRFLDSVPTAPSGFIDTDALSSLISSDERAFEPGRYCTDSHCGFGLLGALIERFAERPFARVLREELLERLSPAGAIGRSENGTICPSSGAGLEINADELGELVGLHLRPERFGLPPFHNDDCLSFLFERRAAYPGWSAGMNGCALGWKTFDGGWLGHNGVGQGRTVMVRLHPGKRIGLAVVCASHVLGAYALTSELLGDALPELKLPPGPRLITERERESLAPRRYGGEFGNRALRIVVAAADGDAGMRVTVTRTDGGAAQVLGTGTLIPAVDDLFFIAHPNTTGMWVLQYLRSGDEDGFDLLWDSANLWKPVRRA